MRVNVLVTIGGLVSAAMLGGFAAADVGGECDYENGVREDAAALAVDAACTLEDGRTCHLFGDYRVLQHGYYGCLLY